MPARRESLAGLRILVVEDEMLVVMLIEEMLQDLRCEIVGPTATLEEALAAVRHHRLDGALLDLNLHGKPITPVVEALLGRAVPFLLVTGYDSRDGDPPALRAAPRVRKPFSLEELAERMVEVFGGAAARR